MELTFEELENSTSASPVFKTPRLLKLFKIARMLRMLKLLRIFKVQKFMMKVNHDILGQKFLSYFYRLRSKSYQIL